MNPQSLTFRWSLRMLPLLVLAGAAGWFGAPPARAAADPKQWNDTVDKAIAYLRKTQNDDGSWGKAGPQQLGGTGVILTGLLQTGKVGPDDPMVEKGLKYIESLINPKAGHIAGKDPR